MDVNPKLFTNHAQAIHFATIHRLLRTAAVARVKCHISHQSLLVSYIEARKTREAASTPQSLCPVNSSQSLMENFAAPHCVNISCYYRRQYTDSWSSYPERVLLRSKRTAYAVPMRWGLKWPMWLLAPCCSFTSLLTEQAQRRVC